jgi:hypothetical protein
MIGTARDVVVIAVADFFIRLFNGSGANKQSQIKINFAGTLRSVGCLTGCEAHLRRSNEVGATSGAPWHGARIFESPFTTH